MKIKIILKNMFTCEAELDSTSSTLSPFMIILLWSRESSEPDDSVSLNFQHF